MEEIFYAVSLKGSCIDTIMNNGTKMPLLSITVGSFTQSMLHCVITNLFIQ